MPPGLPSFILPIILKLWGISAFSNYEILLLLFASQTMALGHCEIQNKRGSCTDLQLGSWLSCELLTLKWSYLTNVFGYWVAENISLCRQPGSPQKWWMWKDIFVCTVQDIHAHGQFGLAFCTGLLQILAEHTAEKCTLTLAAMHVFHRFRFPSDAHRGDQDCSRAATDSKMRLVKKLAVWILVRSWSGMKMKKMSNEQVNRRHWETSLQN